jgi:enoyl-CoA hydratase/carnithine racemase
MTETLMQGKQPAVMTGPDVQMRVLNRVAIVTLNRPSALNALSHDMVRQLLVLLEQCRDDDGIVALVLQGAGQKGFCAGGDVRALYHLAQKGQKDGNDGWLQFFVDEYRLDYALHQFPKPVVALMDGITMGGGMGLGQAAHLRVVTERTKMAMPETRIGFLPDVGATHFLSVMPIELELYVGLTGITLTGADALQCHLADICVPANWLATFEDRLEHMPLDEPILPCLRRVFEPPQNTIAHAPLAQVMPWITHYFDPHSSVDQIVAKLQSGLECVTGNPEPKAQWMQVTLEALTANSPMMLHVTREALLRGRRMSLAECFRMELDIVARVIQEGDFCEGVRAHLIDKDHRPRWSPPTLSQVAPTDVLPFLSSPWDPEKHPLAGLG